MQICIYVHNMYVSKKKKQKKNCDLLPLGSLFLGTELSPSLSLSLFLRADLGKKNRGGGESRLTSG